MRAVGRVMAEVALDRASGVGGALNFRPGPSAMNGLCTLAPELPIVELADAWLREALGRGRTSAGGSGLSSLTSVLVFSFFISPSSLAMRAMALTWIACSRATLFCCLS